ncbi:MAG: mycofactocin precursor MftA [Gemmatimonadales bacterium]
MGATEQTSSGASLATPPPTIDDESVVEADTLVEEISIDGMCGVY